MTEGYYEANGADKEWIIEFITQPFVSSQGSSWTLEHELSQSDILWCIHELQWNLPPKRVKWIGCYRLFVMPNGWGFVKMEEISDPKHYSCPLRYLNAVPEVNPKWRAKVHNYNALLKTAKEKIDDQHRTKTSPDIDGGVD